MADQLSGFQVVMVAHAVTTLHLRHPTSHPRNEATVIAAKQVLNNGLLGITQPSKERTFLHTF